MRSKSNRAGLLAQQLGSAGSWANSFVPGPGHPQGTSTATALPGSHPNVAHGNDISTNILQDGPSNEPPPAYEDVVGGASAGLSPALMDNKQISGAIVQGRNEDMAAIPTTESAEADAKIDPLRSHIRHEHYASITGTYTFFDYLELVSTRGSIDITLDPQPGTKPCFLKLESTSGSIRVALSEEYRACLAGVKDDEDRLAAARTAGNIVCCRPWIVSVRSKHGSIECKLPLGMGSRHFVKARLGSIHATFYATPWSDAFLSPEIFGQHDQSSNSSRQDDLESASWMISEIRTETHHGAQEIRVETPSLPESKKKTKGKHTNHHHDGQHVENESPLITNIAADFWAKQHGSLHVYFPKTWLGRVQAKTNGGEARIDGAGFDLQHFGKREVHGSRGGLGGSGLLTTLRCDGAGSAKIYC